MCYLMARSSENCIELCDVGTLILDLCCQTALAITSLLCDLAARPPVALPYSGSAIHYPMQAEKHTQDTHIVFVAHILCIYSLTQTHTHTQSIGKHTLRPAPPPPPTHTHTNRRECFVHSLTGQLLRGERGWWVEVDGDSKRQRDYKKKPDGQRRGERLRGRSQLTL